MQLGEMDDKLEGGVTLSPREGLQPSIERVIRQPGRGSKDVFMHDRV